MLTQRLAALAVLAIACRDTRDPGFEIVRVPQSAYAAPPDAGTSEASVATSDAGADPVVLCVSRPESDSKDDDEESSDDCPKEYHGRHYDERSTSRHRAKGDDPSVCCYRKGRAGTLEG